MATKIPWTDETWNPITGCTPTSPGCKNCYAKRMSRRLAGRHGYPEAPNHFNVTWHPDKLDRPLHWKRPRRIFVCSMSDLFHPLVGSRDRHKIFCVMEMCRQHAFQLLTKRPEIMAQFIRLYAKFNLWPLENVWIGVTAENQHMANERIPILLRIPAARRFVSLEPLLSEIDLGFGPRESCHWCNGAGEWNTAQSGAGEWVECECTTRNKWLSWVICGAETGPGARPMDLDWARSIRDQCQAADVPFFFKSRGEWAKSTSWIAKGHGGGIASFEDIPDQPVRWKNHAYIGSDLYFRIGKHGNELDGRTWEEFPE